jgi:V8-like Glu-specific endopeptidase
MNLDTFRSRCERAFGNAAPDSVLRRVRAIVGSERAMPATEEGRLAVEGYKKLKDGDAPTPMELAALQLLIRLTRPAPLVHNGRPDDLPTGEQVEAFPAWPAFQNSVACLRLVGRIDRASPTLATAESIGTGLLVAADLIMTNKHVVSVLSRGTDVLQEGQAVVRFDFEDGSFAADTAVAITAVAAIHPVLDVALLRLKPGTVTAASSNAQFEPTPIAENADVVVVGYPLDDQDRNPMFIRNIFGAQFGVLRAAPGQATTAFENGFYHDCSTLGGNSGSPIFSIDRAKVVGLHSSGGFLWKNAAVSAAAIVQFIDNATD